MKIENVKIENCGVGAACAAVILLRSYIRLTASDIAAYAAVIFAPMAQVVVSLRD